MGERLLDTTIVQGVSALASRDGGTSSEAPFESKCGTLSVRRSSTWACVPFQGLGTLSWSPTAPCSLGF